MRTVLKRVDARISEELYNEIDGIRKKFGWNSMASTVAYLLKQQIDFVKKYKAGQQQTNVPKPQQPQSNPLPAQLTPQSGEAKFNLFEEYRERKRECETDDQWFALKREVEQDTRLTQKQKNVIIQYN